MQGIKHTQAFVEKYFVENGCKLLTTYINSHSQLQYLCKCGRIVTSSFTAYFSGSPYCWDCAARKQSHTKEFVENIFRERGCELLDPYKNNHTRMKFKCKCGRISTITFASFHGKGCYCEDCGGTKKLTTEEIRVEIEKISYHLISDYINAKTKLELKCNKGHLCQINWNNFQKGKRCRTCFIDEKWHKPEDRKFVLLCRSLLRNCLKKIRLRKTDHTEILLGYDGIQLKNHITNHSNWNNIKESDWHIDHIFPIKAFCDYNIKDTRLINCLENLQPVIGKENLSKGAKYDKQEFETWLASKGINAPD